MLLLNNTELEMNLQSQNSSHSRTLTEAKWIHDIQDNNSRIWSLFELIKESNKKDPKYFTQIMTKIHADKCMF